MKTEEIITKVAEAPAKALEDAIAGSEHALSSLNKPLHEAQDYWHAVGPGLTTGASDDDPSGIATYSQTGAQFGYMFLWLAPLTFPLMATIQEMCARIGMATGRGLASNIRTSYSKNVVAVLAAVLFFTNTFNLGANLGAMSKAAQLMLPGFHFLTLLLIFTIVSMGLQVFVSYSSYARFLKYLSFVLLLYIATALTLDNLPWKEIWYHTLVPHMPLTKEGFVIVTAILGTTISPYLFFWQTSQEVEERRANGKINIKLRHQSLRKKEVRRMRLDVTVGMLFSNVVMFFVIVTCAAVLFPQGIMVNTAEDAARALLPLAGQQAYTLFALGIIGTGLLAVPVLAGSAAYALAESFHWSFGLNRGLKHAQAFYGVIIFAMMFGFALNLIGINPIKALIWSAVLNGIVAPFIIYFIVKISSNRNVMGKWVNGLWSKAVGYISLVLMTVAAVGAIIAMVG
ncbi:divalent metal cation transporter [bacterium]|nr:MAG: divalent metal cation transporter [bacterium]